MRAPTLLLTRTGTLPSRRSAFARTSRRGVLLAVLCSLLLAIGSVAWAFWSTSGSGTGSASTSTLNPPTNVTVPSAVTNGSVPVSWAAPSSGTTPTGYYVQRTKSGGSTAFACGTSATTSVTVSSCTDTPSSDGTYTYTVTAQKGSWTATSTSSQQVVVSSSVGTITTVASSANPSEVGSEVTYTATVRPSSGSSIPSGTVEFFDGVTPIDCSNPSQSLDATGAATCKKAYAAIGSHSISARYSGSTAFGASTSSVLTQGVTDTTAPTVTSVSSPLANGSYKAGQVVAVAVSFSETVTVTGTPQLSLATGSPATTVVNYASGSGTSVLTFTYTVAAGNTSADLSYTGTGALTLNGGTIRDGSANNAVLALPAPGAPGSLSANKNLVIDTSAPTVSSISRSGASTSVKSGPLSWTVTFSEPVSGLGTSNFSLVTSGLGGTTPTVTSVTAPSGAPSSTWTVTSSASGTTGTNSGSIGVNLTSAAGVADVATNSLSASTPVVGPAYAFDTSAPTVTQVSSPLADGSYKTGQVVPVTVTFSEPVTVTGTPQLSLATGSPAATLVNYTSGSGSSSLTFSYTVAAGNTSARLAYSGANALTLNAGTVQDAASNDATVTLPSPGAAGSLNVTKNLVIDTNPPTVTGLTLFNGGTLGRADTGDRLEVQFSEQLDATKLCSTWTNTGTQSLSGNGIVTVTITDNGTNDILTVSPPTTCSGLAVGTIALGKDYVNANTTFNGNGSNASSVTLTTGGLLTIKLGSGSGTITNTANVAPVYTPPATGLSDIAGNPLASAPFNGTSGTF